MTKIDLTAGTAASLALGGFAALVLSLVWGGFWTGLTLSTLWGWFIAPHFGLPTLTTLQAYGVSLVVASMVRRHTPTDKTKSFGEVVLAKLIEAPALAGLFLLVGWVAKSWM